MPTYVWRQGVLVDKTHVAVRPAAVSELPAPAVHSFASYPSPINERTISSHRQRDRDLDNSGSYDPRDTPAEFRKAQHGRRKQSRRGSEPS